MKKKQSSLQTIKKMYIQNRLSKSSNKTTLQLKHLDTVRNCKNKEQLNWKPYYSIWKVSEVFMILKPGKPRHEILSYRPISVPPVISRILKKQLLKRRKLIIEEKNFIPSHQFGFRSQHKEARNRISDHNIRLKIIKQLC